MPTTIKLDGLMAGFAASAARSGEMVELVARGILTTEDGGRFYSILKEVSASVLSRVPSARESQIDNLVVVFMADLSAEVYVNEVSLVVKVTTKRAVSVGEPVLYDAIADVGNAINVIHSLPKK